ncbi:MAG: WYL domain-containing protein [Gemmatimonadota bacterium]
MPPSKTQRWLDLIAVLVGRRHPIPFEDLMDQVPGYRERWREGTPQGEAAARRMFERDKADLRRMGIPLEHRAPPGDPTGSAGYLIPRGEFYLPYLKLLPEPTSASTSPHQVGTVTVEESDMATAILALREVVTLPSFPFQREALSALRKLTFDLDPALEANHDPAGLAVLDRPGGADPSGALPVLLNGLYDRKRIRFTYRSMKTVAPPEVREADPWGLLFQWGSWYLLGRDPTRGDGEAGMRMFRVDRMAQAAPIRPAATAPEFQVPESFDIRDYAQRKAWELTDAGAEPMPGETVVRVVFQPPASHWAARNGWGTPVEGTAGEGSPEEGFAVREFQVAKLPPFLRWILSLGGDARVVSPPHAVTEMQQLLAKLRSRHTAPAARADE